MKKIKNYFKNKLNELKFKNIRKIIKKIIEMKIKK